MGVTTTTTLSDSLLSQALALEYELLLAARDALPNHPVLQAGYKGVVNMRASNVLKVPLVGLGGYDVPAQYGENIEVPYTDVTDSSYTITVARQAKAYSATDLAKLVDAVGVLDVPALAADAVRSMAVRWTDLVCDVIDGFSTTESNTGVDLDTVMVMSAIAKYGALNSNGVVSVPMGVLHGVQWGDWMQDLATAVGGALQFSPASSEIVALRGQSYQGSFLGIDWFKNNRVVTANAGADRAGAIFGAGSIGWADALVDVEDPANQISIGGKVLFERERNARAGTTGRVSSAFLGVSKAQELGVSIISDA